MVQPVEMRTTRPMTLHGGVMSSTTEVWDMLCATWDGDLDRVTALVARRPELSTCQYNYTPPLHFAVREGHLAVVRALVERGALDPQYKSYPFGDSLVTMAQDRDHHEIADLLQRAVATPGLAPKWVGTGEIEKAGLLLARGADINTIDEEYRSTPLGMAARWGQKAMVTLLLERGADPNKAGAAAPLAWARKKGHSDVARDLTAAGAVSN
jgi:ankyrin repeat protein